MKISGNRSETEQRNDLLTQHMKYSAYCQKKR